MTTDSAEMRPDRPGLLDFPDLPPAMADDAVTATCRRPVRGDGNGGLRVCRGVATAREGMEVVSIGFGKQQRPKRIPSLVRQLRTRAERASGARR